MENNDEKLLKLEKEYKHAIDSQKMFYESEIALLKSKLDYEQSKLAVEYKNLEDKEKEKREIEAFYNVKNVQDKEDLQNYFEGQIASLKEFYEKEIERRQQETAEWNKTYYEEQIENLNKIHEEKIKEINDSHVEEMTVLSQQLIEQKNYYEEILKPYKKLEKIRKKLGIKLCDGKAKEEKDEKALNENSLEEVTTETTLSENLSEEVKNENEEQVKVENQTPYRPKVSVILPVYNVGKYLRQSLDSLINQTLKDIEIICVNDGSTDDCFDILEEYKEKDGRIIVIHKENKGTGAARNDGLRMATGECIGFVDPDDWVKPNMFERLYNLIKEKNLDIAMCMPDGYNEKEGITAPFPYFVDDNFKNIPDDKIFNWRDLSPFAYPMCVWNKLYTKELFDKNDIDFAEGLDFEDHKVIFGTLLTAEKIFFIREKLYVYRYNREGSVLTDNNRRLIDHIEIFNIVEKLMKTTNTFEPLKKDFLTYKIHNILYYYGMIKDEFKEEYYKEMIKSIGMMNLSDDEKKMLEEKFPDFKKLNL